MIEPPAPEQADHVRACAQCAEAVARTERVLAEFGGAYRDWGSRQMRLAHANAKAPRALLWLRSALAATALAAVAIGIPVSLDIQQEHQRAAQIAIEDDALLTQIQADVSRSVPVSMKPLAELTAPSIHGSAE